MSTGRSLRSRTTASNASNRPASNVMLRPNRVTRAFTSSPAVTVSRSPSGSPEESRKSIRLTVKMPSSKLREVTSSSGRGTATGRRSVNIFADNLILTGPRNSRSKKKLVEVNTSDDEDLEEGEDDLDEFEDAPGGEDDKDDDLDADGDIDMDDAPPQPATKRHAKPALTVTPAAKDRPAKSVTAKTMDLGGENDDEDDDDDEELSELEFDAEGEPDESALQDDELGGAAPEDEELDEEDEVDEEEEEEEVDSDEATPATGSRGSTPDLSKLTKRQRGSLGGDFLQLPMGKLKISE
jgi:Ino eighty subunit 2